MYREFRSDEVAELSANVYINDKHWRFTLKFNSQLRGDFEAVERVEMGSSLMTES